MTYLIYLRYKIIPNKNKMSDVLRVWFVRIDTALPFNWDGINTDGIRYILGVAHVGKQALLPHIHFYIELLKCQRP